MHIILRKPYFPAVGLRALCTFTAYSLSYELIPLGTEADFSPLGSFFFTTDAAPVTHLLVISRSGIDEKFALWHMNETLENTAGLRCEFAV